MKFLKNRIQVDWKKQTDSPIAIIANTLVKLLKKPTNKISN